MKFDGMTGWRRNKQCVQNIWSKNLRGIAHVENLESISSNYLRPDSANKCQ